MNEYSADRDYYSIIFIMVTVVIGVLLVIGLLTAVESTTMTRSTVKKIVVECTYDGGPVPRLVVEDAYRRGDIVYVKLPDSIFGIKDPDKKCTITY